MMRSMLAVVVAVVVAATGACGGRDDRAVTINEGDGTSSQTNDKPAVEAPDDPAGDELTQKQVNATLLTVEDLPSGWTLGEPSEDDADDSDDDEISPAKCAEVVEAMGADEEDAVAEGERDFNKGGPFGTVMGVSISSYENEVDSDKLTEIAAVFGECSSFNGADKEGVVTEYKVAPLSLANLGDKSLALTMTVKSEGFTIPINIYLVVIGHNVMTFYNGGVTGADGADLESIGRLAVKRLEETVKS
jgi:hypothetical protein